MPGDDCVFIAIGHFREGVVEDQQAFIRFNDVDGRLDQVQQPEQAGHSMPVLSGRA